MAGFRAPDGCLRRYGMQLMSALLFSNLAFASTPTTLLKVSHYGVGEIGFSFDSDREVNRFECSLDGAKFDSCGLPRFYSGLPIGTHTFIVRAVDLSGSIDPDPATYTWAVTP